MPAWGVNPHQAAHSLAIFGHPSGHLLVFIVPKPLGDRQGIYSLPLPPRPLRDTAVEFIVVYRAQWDHKLVADLDAKP